MKIAKSFFQIGSILGLLILGACSPSQLDLRSFYYPIEQLKEPLVYEYRSLNNDSLGADYWYFRTVDLDSAIYLTGNYYDASLNVAQFFREEIVSNGTVLKDYFLYLTDTAGLQTQIPAEIEYGNVFPFEVQDSNTLVLQKMKWIFQENPLISTTLIRNRRFAGTTTYSYQGKKYDCVQFSLTELIDNYQNGHLEKEYKGLEIYAKGLGLVYYRKEIDKGLILEYELVDTYPMSRLEEQFRTMLNEQ